MAREGRLAYLLFATVGFVQVGVLALIGDSRITDGGLLLMVALVAWLGFHSRVAWWLFVIANTWVLVASAAVIVISRSGVLVTGDANGVVKTVTQHGGQVLWGDVITMILGSSLLLAVLLSRPMRTWVRRTAAV